MAPRGTRARTKRSGGRSVGDSARRRLVAEVAAQREVLLQACWAHQHWNGAALRTRAGQPLEVLAPGWLNRGAGPDFTEARLLIGGTEHWGDVEVHVSEKEWWEHRHDGDERYARVILHVVLRPGGRPAAGVLSGEPLPVFEAGPSLPGDLLEVMDDPEDMLRRYENLPGRCGVRAALAGPEALSRVVAHAAEARARAKAERLHPLLERARGLPGGEEQVLFEQVFHYLGYRPHAALFGELARRFPLAALYPLLELPYGEARSEVLARWFGAAGLLEAEHPASAHPAVEEEYRLLRERWLSLQLTPGAQGVQRAGSRPWNAPERRMVGLFHHLYAMGRGGWLKAWLAVLKRLDERRDEPEFRREVLEALERAFATPPGEPWRRMYTFALPPTRAPARLVGPDRVTVLMANAVLPFFLAVARAGQDVELEKVLYRLYLVMPAEAPNQRTRFMERRLAALVPLRRTLRSHQGLLQVHQDFCTSFHEGCEQCGFPDLIAPAQSGGSV